MPGKLVSLVATVSMLIVACTCAANGFVAGADFSDLALIESKGAAYRDGGQAQDAVGILKRHGITCVRLRLFTSSDSQAQAHPCDYVNNLDYTVPLAVRVKNAGLQFMLDFHYSDTWADPGHQAKPSTWTNLTFAALVRQMYLYNSNCIAAFKRAGAMPDYVQVGNEITSGMLWPDGEVGGSHDTPTQWMHLGQLMNSAIRGIRDAAGTQMPKLVIHIDRGGDWAATQWFFDHLVRQQVQFDAVAESYYPFWHGPLGNLQACLSNAARRYGKPVLLAETAFPWTNSYWKASIVGITPSPTGQVDYVTALAQVVRSVPGGKGWGIFWWGAGYQPITCQGAFDTTSFFDSGGNVLPVTDAVGNLAVPLLSQEH